MGTDDPRVSVVIPTYDAAEYVRPCLRSLRRQRFGDFEVIVVDDGSTDGTVEAVTGFDDDRVRLISRPGESGIPSARNRGIEAARGEFVAVHDADDRSHPARLERQVAFLDEHPEVALVGTGARLVDAEGSVLGRRRVYECPTFEDLLETNHVVHGSVLARREALEAVGGYDESFATAEDYDLYLRLADRYGIANVDEPLYTLRVHRGSTYGRNLETTLVYRYLAVLRARGEAPPFRDRPVEAFAGEVLTRLDDEERAAFHLELARDALRYGDLEVGRAACRDAMAVDRTAAMPYLLYALSFGGESVTSAVARVYRRAVLNPSLSRRNARCDRT